VGAPAACIFVSSKCGCKRRKKSERRFGTRIHASATLLSAPADTNTHYQRWSSGGGGQRAICHGQTRDEEAFQSVTLSCLRRYICVRNQLLSECAADTSIYMLNITFLCSAPSRQVCARAKVDIAHST